MDAKHLVWLMSAGLALSAACQRSQSGTGAAGSSGQEATQGEMACAHEPGVPPQTGEGASPAGQRPCSPSHSVMGEGGRRPEEL